MKKNTKTNTPRLEDVKFLKVGTYWRVSGHIGKSDPVCILVKKKPYRCKQRVDSVAIDVKALYVYPDMILKEDLVEQFNASHAKWFTPITKDKFDMLWNIAGTYEGKSRA